MHSTYQGRWGKTGDAQSSKAAMQQWGAVVGGSALAVIGITRRSPAGWALAAAGGALAYSGLRARTSNGRQSYRQQPELSSNILVNASPQEAFRLWRDLEQAPRYMNHIESVIPIDERRYKWTASGPMGRRLEWIGEITDEREGEYAAWRTEPGSPIEVSGRVEFKPAPAQRGTIVSLSMRYGAGSRRVSRSIPKFLRNQARFFLRQDLRRFKALLETGEIPTTYGQTHGPRSSVDKAAKAINPNRPARRQAQATGKVAAFRRVS